MTAPELLLYWLFYDNNKRSQNIADESLSSDFYLIVAFWLRFLFMAELIWAVVAIFHSEANTAESE